MAKTKKDIKNFQEALSSNTIFLNEDNLEDEMLFGSDEKGDQVISLDQMTYKKFKILARYQKRDTQEIILEALNHYLRLKKLYLEEAMLELTRDK